MTYQEARQYLEQVYQRGSVLGLTALKELLKRLGNPQDDLKFIHIAGTNGKGSVLSYVSAVLEEAGYLVGRYISPTLFHYRERIQVNEEMISRENMARLTGLLAEESRKMEEEGLALPTGFELETAMSFLYFKEKHCDIIVLETGMGGTTDATNVVTTTVLEIIASIGMDHMEFLGDSLEKIAENKAGIIKPGTRVVSAFQEEEASRVLKRVCEERHCELKFVQPSELKRLEAGYERQRFSYKERNNVEISLAGSYQFANAALALEALDSLRNLGYAITEEQVQKGMKGAQWKGRFTLLHKKPAVLVDGAHNPAAAQVLKESLELYFPGKRLYFIFGVFCDKDYKKIIQITAPLAYHILTVQTPDNPRALDAEILQAEVAKVNPSVEACASVAKAVEKSLAMAGEEDVILAFGSLSYLCQVEKALKAMES